MDAWPTESTKRSRFGQIGSSGSNRKNRCHRQYATGAIAIGVPGWPELACCTASMERVRMVLIQSVSSGCVAIVSVPFSYQNSSQNPSQGVMLSAAKHLTLAAQAEILR